MPNPKRLTKNLIQLLSESKGPNRATGGPLLKKKQDLKQIIDKLGEEDALLASEASIQGPRGKLLLQLRVLWPDLTSVTL